MRTSYRSPGLIPIPLRSMGGSPGALPTRLPTLAGVPFYRCRPYAGGRFAGAALTFPPAPHRATRNGQQGGAVRSPSECAVACFCFLLVSLGLALRACRPVYGYSPPSSCLCVSNIAPCGRLGMAFGYLRYSCRSTSLPPIPLRSMGGRAAALPTSLPTLASDPF